MERLILGSTFRMGARLFYVNGITWQKGEPVEYQIHELKNNVRSKESAMRDYNYMNELVENGIITVISIS